MINLKKLTVLLLIFMLVLAACVDTGTQEAPVEEAAPSEITEEEAPVEEEEPPAEEEVAEEVEEPAEEYILTYPHLFHVPQHDLIPRIAGQIKGFPTKFRMAIIREDYHSAAITIQHSTVFYTAGKESQFCPISHPVDRVKHVPGSRRFKIKQFIAVAFME